MNTTQKTLIWSLVGLGGIIAGRLINQQQRAIDLQGRVALITGGSRGLGLEMARVLVESGAKVAICARNEEDLESARRELNIIATDIGNPHEVLSIPCDVTDQAQVQAMIRQIKEHFGPVEILINNASTVQVGPLEEMETREFEESINIHYWAPFYTMEEVLPEMRKRGEGRIVNISSIGGKVSIPHLLPYSAGKHALVGLSEGYRAELLKDNIYVTTVCPGLMRTGSPKNALFKGKHREEQSWFTLGDSLWVSSVSARNAAEEIVGACRTGQSTLVLSPQAKLLAGVNGLFPGLVSDVLGLVNRLLPEPGGIGKERMKGHESESDISPSKFTEATEKAARRNNEM